MRADTRDSPLYRLTRHFFAALFDFGFLSEAGAESFERMVAGICALFLSLGLLLVRVFLGQYARLASLPDPEPLRLALLAGHSFVMALPMWIVAFVTVLISHSLFPDETDFRVLVPLPIGTRLIFGAKLLALAIFACLFILSAHVALTPLMLMMSGRSSGVPVPICLAAFEGASIIAAIFAVLLITAINGLLVLAASRGHLMGMATTLRSALVCALVLSLPLLGRLSDGASHFADDRWTLYLSPPAWFVGVEETLLGRSTPQFLRLAALAAVGTALAATVTIATYVLLYRHFERVTRQPAVGGERPWSPERLWRFPHRPSSSSAAAIRGFIGATLRRSALHQGVLVFITAIGVGLALNSLTGIQVPGPPSRDIALTAAGATIIWAPFVLMLFATVAVRSALTLPTEQRANWVFRMTESPSMRVQTLRAALGSVVGFGVLLPVAAVAPLHWRAFGGSAVVTLTMTVLGGLLLVEFLMKHWSRMPFSCSYIPGKRFIPASFLIGLAFFAIVTGIGPGIVRLSLAKPGPGVFLGAVVTTAILVLRRQRLAIWKDHPLLFDDRLPTEVNPLRLSMD